MELAIVWEREDGGISVTYPCPQARNEGETDEAFVARILAKDVPPGRPNKIIRKSELPAKRTFRDAWKFDGQAITIDTPKAREIVLARVREERNRRLAESDAEKARLDDVGTAKEKKDAKDKRQKLRDLPAVVASEIATMSVEQLETYIVTWPT